MTPRTKVIIVNSPNNPSGVHYSESWMREFADFMREYPDLIVISDEVYSDISYLIRSHLIFISLIIHFLIAQ